MTQSLKEKAVKGVAWSALDNFANIGIQFIVGIILARLLTPREFGLIGMLTIFIAVSQSFIDSGFSQALIRKQNAQQKDYSTVFYFNLLVGIVFYLILFFSSGIIAGFFDEPKLELLLQVLGFELIINAFTIVQTAKLTKEINFKLQTKITIIASVLSGGIGLGMAYAGFGVWSLVGKTLSMRFFLSVLLCLWNKWRPTLEFSKESFKEMFSFGSKLLVSGLIDTTYRNIYNLIIGKYFSAEQLGYYTRAQQFQKLPSSNLNSIISKVTFPVLSEIQEDDKKLKSVYKQIISSTMLITFFLMLLMAAIAEPMIYTLIGKKWSQSVIYLQLLCFVGILYPLHALNLDILKVKGRPDLFLKLEIVKKIIVIPVLFIGIYYGIIALIIGTFVISMFGYYLNSYYSGKLINYFATEQIRDIIPSFLVGLFISAIVYSFTFILQVSNLIMLILQIVIAGVLFIGFNELIKQKEYLFIKENLILLINKNKKVV